MTTITLTKDQQTAIESFNNFILDPFESVFVLSGYSGTGKSTLVSYLIEHVPKLMKAAKLVNPKLEECVVKLTATTNKAAENFSSITGMDVSTIHSFLSLRVHTNYSTGVSTLTETNATVKEHYVLFIDEASFIDPALLRLIFKRTANCKIVFIGDPAQLTPIKAVGTPVFESKFSGAQLTQVVRQAAGNPIVELSTKFRNTVNSGNFFQFKPDGNAVKYLDRDAFNEAVKEEFTRTDWAYQDSKVLAWTNKCVISYNHFIREHVKGDPKLQLGDYAVCNKFMTLGRDSIKTDQLVRITEVTEDTKEFDVVGNYYKVDNKPNYVFCPKKLADKNNLLKYLRSAEEFETVRHVEESWIDLRAAYACTVNKSQGSTFDKVFIDVSDIARCNISNTLARMMYVAVSRARNQVILTGDFV